MSTDLTDTDLRRLVRDAVREALAEALDVEVAGLRPAFSDLRDSVKGFKESRERRGLALRTFGSKLIEIAVTLGLGGGLAWAGLHVSGVAK